MDDREYRAMYEREDHHWWFLGKRAFIAAVLPKPSGRWRVLDLGAGTGGLSRWLGRWGRVTRVESSSIAQSYLRNNHLTFFASDIGQYRGTSNSFDLVCLCDVLYHKNVKSDHQALNNAYRMVRPGGLLLITESAAPWLWSSHDLIMHGKKRYWLSELMYAVERCGGEVIHARYTYFFVFPAVFIIRLIAKRIPLRSVSAVHPLLNRLLYSLCRREAWVGQYIHFPIGSSLIIVAKKPLPGQHQPSG